ncbi:MAG: hypothetical protein M1268_02510 [Patescibacteria group bacterium]|nr:hypothetical protein [Patescibacteria group bacterium]
MPRTPEAPNPTIEKPLLEAERKTKLQQIFVSRIRRAVEEHDNARAINSNLSEDTDYVVADFVIQYRKMGEYESREHLMLFENQGTECTLFSLSDNGIDKSILKTFETGPETVTRRTLSEQETRTLINILTSPQLNIGSMSKLMKHTREEEEEIDRRLNPEDYWGEDKEREEESEDARVEVVDPIELKIGDRVGIEFAGNKNSFVYLDDIFNWDNTLVGEYEEVIVEGDDDAGDILMRIGKDGKTTSVWRDWLEAKGEIAVFKKDGKLKSEDFKGWTVVSGDETAAVILFNTGLADVKIIERIVAITGQKPLYWMPSDGIKDQFEKMLSNAVEYQNPQQ